MRKPRILGSPNPRIQPFHGRLLVVDKPADPLARRRRAPAARARRAPHRPHRHARSAGQRALPLVVGPRDRRLARFLSAERQVVRGRHPPRRLDRHRRRRKGRRVRHEPRRRCRRARSSRPRSTRSAARSSSNRRPTRRRRSTRNAAATDRPRRAPRRRAKPEGAAGLPDPVRVTVHRLDIVDIEADAVTLRVDCSAGFYVRSLAHDLGERLGPGAHLRRAADQQRNFTLAMRSVGESDADATRRGASRDRAAGAHAAALASVVLTTQGARATHGRDVGPTRRVACWRRSDSPRLRYATGCRVRTGRVAVRDSPSPSNRQGFSSLRCSGVTC